MPPKAKTEDKTAGQPEADAAQVAAQPDPVVDPAPDAVAALKSDEREDELCPVHFPAGWASRAITYADERTNTRTPSVTCEHGTYRRPAEKA